MSNRIVCHCRGRRQELGLSQAELARRAGLTRQAISAIESGSYVPSTLTALEIARALETTVERLFSLDTSPGAGPAWELASTPAAVPARVAAAMVRERPLAYAIDLVGRASPLPADGTVAASGAIEIQAPATLTARTAVVLGCDPALDFLGSHFDGLRDDLRVLALPASSERALAAVAGGTAHIAGSHLGEAGDAAFDGRGGIVVCFATWEQGLAVAAGNPLGVRGVADLVRPGVRFVNREPGSGARAMIDHALATAGIAREDGGDAVEAAGHFEVAMRVAAGHADAGVCPHSVARAFGLEFVPLAETRFDLSIPADLVAHPAVAAVLELVSSGRFRAMLASLPGYSAGLTGKVLAEIPAA